MNGSPWRRRHQVDADVEEVFQRELEVHELLKAGTCQEINQQVQIAGRLGATAGHGAEDAQLTAFHYFAVADTTDLSVLKWRRGGCVSVEHARFMAERFCASGFAAEALDASTPADVRQARWAAPDRRWPGR